MTKLLQILFLFHHDASSSRFPKVAAISYVNFSNTYVANYSSFNGSDIAWSNCAYEARLWLWCCTAVWLLRRGLLGQFCLVFLYHFDSKALYLKHSVLRRLQNN